MREQLEALAEALLQFHLQCVVAAGRFVVVVPQALRPSKGMSEADSQLLGVAVEVRLPIVKGKEISWHGRVDGIDFVKPGYRSLVRIELVRGIEHVVNA